jgi:hypothetical protein
MTFFGGTIACAHCIVNDLCTRKQKKKTKQSKTKPKAHYKCISVMVHVIKFQPTNKTTNFIYFEEAALSNGKKILDVHEAIRCPYFEISNEILRLRIIGDMKSCTQTVDKH